MEIRAQQSSKRRLEYRYFTVSVLLAITAFYIEFLSACLQVAYRAKDVWVEL
jgi:hypothetical protein